MMLQVSHSANVVATEQQQSSLAGSQLVDIEHRVAYSVNAGKYFRVWSSDVELVAFQTKTLTLASLTFARLNETRDLYTDQTLSLVAFQLRGNAPVTVVFKRGQDDMATIPLAPHADLHLSQPSLPLFGDHVDRIELLAINQNTVASSN